MNWQLVTSVVLVLNAPYNVGMAASSSAVSIQGVVSNVIVSGAKQEQTIILTDDGSDSPTLNIFPSFRGSSAAVIFDRDYVTLPVDVGVFFSTTNATTYPEGDAYSKLYPSENVVPLGPLFQFELSYSAIKFNDDPVQKVMIVAPVLNPEYRGFFDPADPLGVEVRIRRADGSESFSLEEYVAGGAIILYKGAFDQAYGDELPNIISVSVQPVDYSGVLKQRQQNQQDERSLGAAQTPNSDKKNTTLADPRLNRAGPK